MTVVVVTRDTLCADQGATYGELILPWPKVARIQSKKLGEIVVAFSGYMHTQPDMTEWLKGEMKPEDFPRNQLDGEKDCSTTVLTLAGEVLQFLWSPNPVRVGLSEGFAAFGSGAPVATGALAVGALPGEAVRAANKFCASCGFGVAGYTRARVDGQVVFEYWEIP